MDYVDAAGKRRRLSAPTKEAAEQLLADKLVEARQALPSDVDPDISFDSYADSWIRQQTANGLAPGTVANYQQMLALYVRPAFGRQRGPRPSPLGGPPLAHRPAGAGAQQEHSPARSGGPLEPA